MILQPGEFNVSDYRKPIPNRVKLKVAAREHEFDHRPPLCDRPYDTEAQDFIPPQHDPEHIEMIRADVHLERTTGRKAGAGKTATTIGSDIQERARSRRLQARQAVDDAIAAQKAGADQNTVDAILSTAKRRRKPKKAWPSRPFPKGRGFEKRERSAS